MCCEQQHQWWTHDSFIQGDTYQQDNSVWHVNLTLLHPFCSVISEDIVGHHLGYFQPETLMPKG